jgi:hypothetical protein
VRSKKLAGAIGEGCTSHPAALEPPGSALVHEIVRLTASIRLSTTERALNTTESVNNFLMEKTDVSR